ncbi:mandelate racemase/muconate lactonizing enzyme family protein [Segetibacter aerophilus]|uniref:Dipeptide epimerase n=1 Tax=Segetibacter aerophilus TaxID=670293 RepID=A0A512B6F0_9BACT|nr:dipeptide epimerase [Segetibacter aerophilus]GEO07542.1 dipeptide epimerase [Segetibacter aerophilus]
MKITHTEIYRYSIPMEPFAIATGTMRSAQNVFIRVFTDEGIYGAGECSAFPYITGETQETCLVMARDFAALWKEKDALNIEDRLKELDAFAAGNPTIKSAFDMALYDLAAKVANVPLYKYLGGEKRTIETDITIGIGPVEEMVEKAKQFEEQGANILKVKIGKNAYEDVEKISHIRQAVKPGTLIRVDANQGWVYEDAVFALQALDQFDIEFCEQPMRTWYDDYLPELCHNAAVHVMADESCYNHHDARRLIQTKSCDSINIKLAKSGGIAGALKIHQLAEEAGIPCMIGGMLESRFALTANLHFAWANQNVQYYDLDTCLLGHLEDPVVGGATYDKFILDCADAPGIGADVDNAFLSRCEHWKV